MTVDVKCVSNDMKIAVRTACAYRSSSGIVVNT